MSKPLRTGSFPFMNIADDFGLPYGAVLLFAERQRPNHRDTAHHLTALGIVYNALRVVEVVRFKRAIAEVRRP
jgi:hypothetical protein